MNNAKIISVNPGIKTLGELNINEINLARLSRTISRPGQSSSYVKNILNFVFGLNSRVNTHFSSKMLALRVIAGTFMTGLGAMALIGSAAVAMPHLLAVAACALGISMLSGTFMRLVSVAVAITGAYSLYLSVTAGAADMTSVMVAMVACFGAVLGPGHYSADMYLRRSLHRIYRNANRYDPDRNASNLHFEYNAFASVDDRLS